MRKNILFNKKIYSSLLIVVIILNILNNNNYNLTQLNFFVFLYFVIFFILSFKTLSSFKKIKKNIVILLLISLLISITSVLKNNKNIFTVDVGKKNITDFMIISKDESFKIEILANQNNLGTIIIPLKINSKSDNRQNLLNINFKLIDINNNKIYDNNYEIILSDFEMHFPFGFPIEKDSRNKRYYIEVKNLSHQNLLVGRNDKEITITKRYVYSLRSFDSINELKNFIGNKIINGIKIEYFFPMIFQLIIFSIMIIFLKSNKKNEQELFCFMIFLILSITVYLSLFNYSEKIVSVPVILNNRALVLLNLYIFLKTYINEDEKTK